MAAGDPVHQRIVPDVRLNTVFPYADLSDQAHRKDHPEHPQADFEQPGGAELAGIHQQSAFVCPAQEHAAARILGQAFVVVGKRTFRWCFTDVEQRLAKAMEVGDVTHRVNPRAQGLSHRVPRLDAMHVLTPGIAVHLQGPIGNIDGIRQRSLGEFRDDLLALEQRVTITGNISPAQALPMPGLHQRCDQRLEIAEALPGPGKIILRSWNHAAQVISLDDVRAAQTNTRSVLGFEKAVGIVLSPRDDQSHVDAGEIYLRQLLLLQPSKIELDAPIAFWRVEFQLRCAFVALLQAMKQRQAGNALLTIDNIQSAPLTPVTTLLVQDEAAKVEVVTRRIRAEETL